MKAPTRLLTLCTLIAAGLWSGCGDDTAPTVPDTPPTAAEILAARFGDAIDLAALPAYSAQPVPRYIRKDNAGGATVNDAVATLGRVLFHDRELSVDRSTSCASCHHQALAFGDTARASVGMSGVTGRHSMRLVDIRFAAEPRMFWDERADDLPDQVLQPIADHIEMGFSGQDGRPGPDALLDRLEDLDYYQVLFGHAYGDSAVTADRLQEALVQFVRTIYAFDTRYDAGRAEVTGDADPFPNFTEVENRGKELFMRPPDLDDFGVRTGGGLACAGCHRPPEFDIDPEMRNNGLIRTIAGGAPDLGVTRAPTLRSAVRADGLPYTPLMHTGDLDLDQVLDHYDVIDDEGNTNLDNRLHPMGNPQRLLLTADERAAVKAFLRTLDSPTVVSDPRWSDPFVQQKSD